MSFQEALDFVEQLIYDRTGKHLNDLEREVFIGSWQGKTYEEIYPMNPQYVEKYVGYKLWQKLSKILGEKVTKKKIRGAVERAKKRKEKKGIERVVQGNFIGGRPAIASRARVFISHCPQEPDCKVAADLSEAIAGAGHQPFMASIGAMPSSGAESEEDWLAQIETELQKCDYFLLLLSPETAYSEMLIEELRQTKEIRDSRQNGTPVLLPIRVNCPATVRLNHDLRSYLSGTQPREWFSPADTPALVREILNLVATNGDWKLESAEEWDTSTTVDSDSDTSAGFKIQPALTPRDRAAQVKSIIPSPSPVGEPELPKGQVRLASSFYLERVPYEGQCYREIANPGALIRLKAPRQMGKTSLMARILYQAREYGYRTVPLSFQHADKTVFTNLNELLRWFCARISRKLRLPHQVDNYWSDTYGSKDNCTAYFEDFLLSETNEPLVLGLDEVDRVFQYPNVADDFFALLRAWYEEAGYGATDSQLWEKLRLVVVHSTEVYIPMDVNQSPFNVGLPIELSEFSSEQVSDLARRHGLHWNIKEIEQLMRLVGGHPYLVRVAFYNIVQQQLTLEQLVQIGPTEAGIYGDHLRRHLWNLQQHPELAAAFSQVVSTNKPVELESVLAFKLHSMGLVQLEGNQVTPRFELYRQYFGERLSI